MDPFESEWLPGQFSRFLEELAQRHKAARNRALGLSGEVWASLEPNLPLRIAERMMKRVISVLRAARHGGTVVFVPPGPQENRPASTHTSTLGTRSRTSGPDAVSPTLW